MVNKIDQMLGIVERTSADVGDGRWVPGMPMQRGYLWASTVEGTRVMAFEVAPGQILLAIEQPTITRSIKRASGLNMVVEVEVTVNGERLVLTLVAPRGRLKRILTFMGHPV